MVKIIYEERGFTSGDCTTHYNKVHFESNPTLREFLDWVISKKEEWGYVRLNSWPDSTYEYRWGKVVKDGFDPKDKDRKIELISVDGGWSNMDYTIKFVGEGL